MNGKDIKYQQAFRFKKWSGKSYAIFASLNKEVTIGFLGVKSLGLYDLPCSLFTSIYNSMTNFQFVLLKQIEVLFEGNKLSDGESLTFCLQMH